MAIFISTDYLMLKKKQGRARVFDHSRTLIEETRQAPCRSNTAEAATARIVSSTLL